MNEVPFKAAARMSFRQGGESFRQGVGSGRVAIRIMDEFSNSAAVEIEFDFAQLGQLIGTNMQVNCVGTLINPERFNCTRETKREPIELPGTPSRAQILEAARLFEVDGWVCSLGESERLVYTNGLKAIMVPFTRYVREDGSLVL